MNTSNGPEEEHTSADPDCLICRKQRGKFSFPGGPVYQDDLVFASHAHLSSEETEQYLGWLVLETRRHTPDLASLNEREAQRVGAVARLIARALETELEAEKVYAFIIGEGVAHFHMHLVPRYPGTPREYWGVRVDQWPDAPRAGERAIAELCDKLRSRLNATLKP